MRILVTILLLAAPQFALAEVSDKVPHELELAAFGIVGASISFVAAARKWWLAVCGALLSVVAILGAIDLLELRQALWQERGLPYREVFRR